jgi:hypothetical protein
LGAKDAKLELMRSNGPYGFQLKLLDSIGANGSLWNLVEANKSYWKLIAIKMILKNLMGAKKANESLLEK